MSHTTFKDWPAMAAGLILAIKELHKGAPGVVKAFREMGGAAHEGGALDSKTKQLLAVAIPASPITSKARASTARHSRR